MALDFPVRVRNGPPGGERPWPTDLPAPVQARMPLVLWARRNRRLLTVGVFVFAVLGFSGAWAGGALVLDGPGTSLYVRLALDHIGAHRSVPYWLPDLWTGAPVWAAMPSLPVFLVLPAATALGPDVAVKVGILGFQILGACGAYGLARSLWRDSAAALVAGVVFALQPLVLSHGALAGDMGVVGVMATAPWLAWSLRRGLAGDGPGYLAVAGLLGGFAALLAPGYALGLTVLAAALVGAEAGRAGGAGAGRLLARAGAAAAVAVGTSTYWLFPFASLRRAFVAPTVEVGRAGVGRDLGALLGRGRELTGAVGMDRRGLAPLFSHLGFTCVVLTLLGVALLARRGGDGDGDRDRDRTVAAVLLSGFVGLWLSTGGVALAASSPASGGRFVPFLLAGVAAGALLGAMLRPAALGRWAPVAVLGTFAVFAAAPYLTPFAALQRHTRLDAAVPLALAVGAAFPVVVARRWATANRGPTAPAGVQSALAAALALVVVSVFLLDVWPYRSYYRVHPPATGAAYREVAAGVASSPATARVTPGAVEPSAVAALVDAGRPLTAGWPRSAAGDQAWRLTAEPLPAPAGYRQRAYGLSATAFQVTERTADAGTAAERVATVDLASNPAVLPMVRAYTHTVAMAGDDLTAELAVALAARNVGVYTGSPSASAALGATTVVDVRSATPCTDDSGARIDPGLASELGVACGLHAWLGSLDAGVDLLNIADGVGAVFRSTTDRLQGISAYLDRAPDRAELSLREVGAGAGGTLGPELARAKAVGTDENGMVAFTFDPIAGSAGKDYGFVLTCPGCPPDRVPRLAAGHVGGGKGDLLVAGGLQRDRAAAFAPIYDPVAADPPALTTVTPSRPGPGRWRIRASGTAPALVVVAEAWFPGWQARVDGRRAPLVQADGAFLGVPVDAGDHVVTLEYHRPAAAVLGRLVTAATLLTAAGLALRRRRRLPVAVVTVAVALPPPSPPAPAPLLTARERLPEARPPAARPRSPAPPVADPEADWDEVVVGPRHEPAPPPAPAPGEAGENDPPPGRRPPTVTWPPEPS